MQFTPTLYLTLAILAGTSTSLVLERFSSKLHPNCQAYILKCKLRLIIVIIAINVAVNLSNEFQPCSAVNTVTKVFL